MPAKTASLDDLFTEQELRVIAEAIQEFIDKRAEAGEACQECSSIEEDDDGTLLHTRDCPVTAANMVREKLAIEVPDI